MPALFKNNATATIAATINNSTTTIVLSAGLGSLFPSPSGGSYFYGTLFDSANNYEIIKVTARSTDTLTVVRGQDNTTALSFNAGSGFAMRPTAAIFENLVQLDGAQTISGAKTFSSAITYGGVTLANSATGTSSMVLSASPTFTGVPAAPTAAFGTNTTQIATTAFVQAAIPAGVIVMWSGSIASIPSGWLLCNGSSGTPDLRDRFVVGAGSTYAVAATGGSADAVVVTHTHTASSSVVDSGHSHTIDTLVQGGSPDKVYPGAAGGTQNTASTNSAVTGISVNTTITSAGTSGTGANLPPYYALAYIMKT